MNTSIKYRKNSLRLKNRDYFLPGPYFFTICTIKRKEFFRRESIRDQVIEIVKKLATQTKIKMHAIVVAIDHIYGLITLPESRKISLSQHVGIIKVKTTQNIGADIIHCHNDNLTCRGGLARPNEWKTQKGGQAHPYAIWQRSYYDHIIRNEKDFNEKAKYIENHPFKEESKGLVEWH